ncbi:hypothetical protein [Fibrobacter sp.]
MLKINIRSEYSLFVIFLVITGGLGLKGLFSINYVYLMSVILCFVALLNLCKTKGIGTYFVAIFLGLFSSALSSYYFEGQGIFWSIVASYNMIFLLFFYVLVFLKVDYHVVHRFVGKASLFVLACYLFQVIIFPNTVFAGAAADWVANSKNSYRCINLYGQIFIPIGFFFYLNKFFMNRKCTNLLFVALFTLPFLLRSFRIMIFAAIVSAIVMFIRIEKKDNFLNKLYKVSLYLVVFGFVVMIAYCLNATVADSIDWMIMRINVGEESLSNDDYIRTMSINYVYSSHFKNYIEMFFGSGMPHGSSLYGQRIMLYMMGRLKFNYVDWGVIGWSWFIGMPTILSFLYLQIKTARSYVEKKYLYVPICFVYFMITSFTDPESYQNGALIGQSTLIYFVYSYHKSLGVPLFSRRSSLFAD